MYIGAIVLLPEGYDEHPAVSYPVIYEQGHFGLEPPLFMQMEAADRPRRNGEIPLRRFHCMEWRCFPRMIGVTFQHPTPYFDDSYAVIRRTTGRTATPSCKS